MRTQLAPSSRICSKSLRVCVRRGKWLAVRVRRERAVRDAFDVELLVPEAEEFPVAADAIGDRLDAPLPPAAGAEDGARLADDVGGRFDAEDGHFDFLGRWRRPDLAGGRRGNRRSPRP